MKDNISKVGQTLNLPIAPVAGRGADGHSDGVRIVPGLPAHVCRHGPGVVLGSLLDGAGRSGLLHQGLAPTPTLHQPPTARHSRSDLVSRQYLRLT